MRNGPFQDFININASSKSDQNASIFLKILGGNEILTSIKGHNSVEKLTEIFCNGSCLDFVYTNIYLKISLQSINDFTRYWA